MKKIVVPIIITLGFLLVNSVCMAQTNITEDTTKIKASKHAEIKKSNEVKVDDSDTTKQHKITVNDDGVKSKRKVKKLKTSSTQSEKQPGSEKKVEEKVISPIKEE